jgi:hypothetical protein
MREKLLNREKTATVPVANSQAVRNEPVAGRLERLFAQAQRTYGNRSLGLRLQTILTNTACSCGKSTGSADECEQCQTAAIHPLRPTKFAANFSTKTLDSGGDTETIGRRDDRSNSIDDGSQSTQTLGCSVSGAFSSIPSGAVAATLSGSRLSAAFSMLGSFTPSIPCTCGCGEYRQFVRGTFTKNGAAVTHALCGTNLDPTAFQEDCGIVGGTTYRYGYRSQSFATSKFTNPDQATGCTFEGQDAPGISGASGDVLSMNLDFQGKLIDTCNGNSVLASSAWTVSGTATVP